MTICPIHAPNALKEWEGNEYISLVIFRNTPVNNFKHIQYDYSESETYNVGSNYRQVKLSLAMEKKQ